MSTRAKAFVNTWIAVELLSEAASGETADQVEARYKREAAAAGLSEEEAQDTFTDPDIAKVIAKHGASV